MRILLLSLLIIFSFTIWSGAQNSGHSLRKQGDRHFDRKEYPLAEEAYRKSNLIEPGLKGSFNLGNTVYRQEKYEEAIRQFEHSASIANNSNQKANAFYNLGNAHFMNGQLDKSVESYKEALKLNPKDLQAKQNLLMALSELRKQQASSSQQSQQNQSESEEEETDQTGSQGPGEEANEDTENLPEEPESREQNMEHKKLSKKQVEQLLEIINEEDQKVQEKLRKTDGQNKKSQKDW